MKNIISIVTTFVLIIFSLCIQAETDSPVIYKASFGNTVHHEARISVTFPDIKTDKLQLRMSRSSPGRYALHEFAKNVYSVEVVNSKGKPLSFTRPNPYQWDVAGHDGKVTVSYTLYADRAGGTYSGIDSRHAHLNMPATFMWARGFDDRPIRISFEELQPKWKIATQLAPTRRANTFTAPNLQYFLDSPTEISNFSLRTWKVKSNEETYTIRLAVHHEGTEDEMDTFMEMAKTVVAEQQAVFGELPKFDYGTYTFIADFLPHVSGDGMEHRNSTILASTRSFEDAEFRQIGVLSHEFFHAWNVERIRPKELEPFNFEQANMSQGLWFAEGFTSYYGGLLNYRSGSKAISTEAMKSEREKQGAKKSKAKENGKNKPNTHKDYAGGLARSINALTNSPARSFFSAIEMSMQAPFRDAATALDPTNTKNTYISYYTYGAAIALALDLTLRSQFEGLNLDDYMKQVWLEYGQQEVAYSVDDLRNTLGKYTKNQSFANEFFNKYISGRELPNYKELLSHAGFLLQTKNRGKASLGAISFKFDGKEAIISQSTLIGSPLYRAGLDRDDQIVKLGKIKIKSQKDWDKALKRFKPGDSTTIHFVQRSHDLSKKITFIEEPTLELVTFEKADMDVTDKMKTFRKDWLESKQAL